MGKGELLILAAAIVIFAMFTVSLTRHQLNIARTNNEAKIENYLIAEARSFLERLEILKFDHQLNDDNTIPFGFVFPDSLTLPDSLGVEADGLFNDIDDFRGVFANDTIKINNTPYYWNYSIHCRVYYVDNNLDSTGVSAPTQKKRVDVIMKSDYLRNDITFSRVFSFY